MSFKGGDIGVGCHIPQLDRIIRWKVDTIGSPAPEASNFPLGENATDQTPSVCPLSVAILVCVATAHSLTVSSCDPEASNVPSGENATEVTPSVCPPSRATSVPGGDIVKPDTDCTGHGQPRTIGRKRDRSVPATNGSFTQAHDGVVW